MLTVALLLATLNKALIDWAKRPIEQKWPDLDLWWLIYVAGISGWLIGWFAEVNLLGDYVANEILARVLSSLLIGGGSAMINDLFAKAVK